MKLTKISKGLCAGLLTLGCIVGCTGGGMSGSISPGSIASEAMASLDSDGNGQLSKEELKNCPGMLKALSYYDSNGDGSISADEISARWTRVQSMPRAPLTTACRVTRAGRPLAGVTVLLEPEGFFGNALEAGQGTTDNRGECVPNRGESPGVMAGIYKVRITDPNNDIPAKYNTNTTLGAELAFDMGRDAESLDFNLKF